MLAKADIITLGLHVLVPPGSGAVVRRGLKKIAVYCDDAGQLYEQSAVCPHLGGIVAWNHSEKRGIALVTDRDSTGLGKWSMGRLFRIYSPQKSLRLISKLPYQFVRPILSNIDQTLCGPSGTV